MDVFIICGVFECFGFGWVFEIDEDEVGLISVGVGCSVDGDGILFFFIDNNVVSVVNG